MVQQSVTTYGDAVGRVIQTARGAVLVPLGVSGAALQGMTSTTRRVGQQLGQQLDPAFIAQRAIQGGLAVLFGDMTPLGVSGAALGWLIILLGVSQSMRAANRKQFEIVSSVVPSIAGAVGGPGVGLGAEALVRAGEKATGVKRARVSSKTRRAVVRGARAVSGKKGG